MSNDRPQHPLAEYRERHGLKLGDLAQSLGVTRWTLWAIENGKRDPSIKLVGKLVNLTGKPREVWRPDVYQAAQPADFVRPEDNLP